MYKNDIFFSKNSSVFFGVSEWPEVSFSLVSGWKNSTWYPGTNGCPMIGSDNMLVQRRTDRQADRQTDGHTTKRVYKKF